MMSMEVIDEDDGDEGSDDGSIDFIDDEEKNIIDEDDSLYHFCKVNFVISYLYFFSMIQI